MVGGELITMASLKDAVVSVRRSVYRGWVIDWVVGRGLRLIAVVPHTWRIRLFAPFYRACLALSSRYRSIAEKNMSLVFPERSDVERREILKHSAESFARMVSDVFRISELTEEWFRRHVTVEREAELIALVGAGPVLFLGGHLGSFDLMVAAFGALIQPIDFIVRENKIASVEEWSMRLRTRSGNGVIPRSGGLRRILSQMNKGRSVGFLFDQNVTRNHAIFVEWFGRVAATTVAPGLVAERVRCPVIVGWIRYDEGDTYTIRWEALNESTMYDPSFTVEQVREAVLRQAVAVLERAIKDQPADWFWLHRRWKTAPEGMLEDFYTKG